MSTGPLINFPIANELNTIASLFGSKEKGFYTHILCLFPFFKLIDRLSCNGACLERYIKVVSWRRKGYFFKQKKKKNTKMTLDLLS
uniref:Uncharacterized protein n=1 Tax=Pyxicephalus adspersus TaxID=30357 RepID=A0AAV3A5Q5_PYXAD|nr:TPA: hypothetical protein GDO54_017028 [Pyxicephalus adspersus]